MGHDRHDRHKEQVRLYPLNPRYERVDSRKIPMEIFGTLLGFGKTISLDITGRFFGPPSQVFFGHCFWAPARKANYGLQKLPLTCCAFLATRVGDPTELAFRWFAVVSG